VRDGGERASSDKWYDATIMKRELRVFRTFADADRADDAYYASLSPQERVDLLLDLIARYQESLGEAASRLERVCRVVPLAQS
jgi:hypothetical protein